MTVSTAAMLVIGDEILSGRTRDSNLHFLAGELTRIGITLREARIVADIHPEIVAAVRALSASYTHIFTSGGIGPTHDDITADSIAAAFGATATLHFERVYPATVNTQKEAEFARDVAVELVGQENVVWDLDPSMGSEDFSFMLQEKPGAYVRLGQGGMESGCFLHNTKYDFNDEVIPLGAGYLAALAERALPLA